MRGIAPPDLPHWPTGREPVRLTGCPGAHGGPWCDDDDREERVMHHDATLVLRGWTGEFLQIRRIGEDDYRLWHPDGSYFGRLIPDGLHRDDSISGTVFGPTGIYLADAEDGRLHVDALRRRARATATGIDPVAFASPGSLEPVERRWPRRA